jgi:hypothetical protein
MWQTLQYDMMVATFHIIFRWSLLQLESALGKSEDTPYSDAVWWSRMNINSDYWKTDQAKSLKRSIISFLKCLLYEIPPSVLCRLRETLDKSSLSASGQALQITGTRLSGTELTAQSTPRLGKPAFLNTETRAVIWGAVEQTMQLTITDVFCSKIQNIQNDFRDNALKSTTDTTARPMFQSHLNVLDFIGRTIFNPKTWGLNTLESAQRALRKASCKQ